MELVHIKFGALPGGSELLTNVLGGRRGDRQTHRQIDKQADRETDGQAGRQTDRQIGDIEVAMTC